MQSTAQQMHDVMRCALSGVVTKKSVVANDWENEHYSWAVSEWLTGQMGDWHCWAILLFMCVKYKNELVMGK